jgi:hypothetical protein
MKFVEALALLLNILQWNKGGTSCKQTAGQQLLGGGCS